MNENKNGHKRIFKTEENGFVNLGAKRGIEAENTTVKRTKMHT